MGSITSFLSSYYLCCLLNCCVYQTLYLFHAVFRHCCSRRVIAVIIKAKAASAAELWGLSPYDCHIVKHAIPFLRAITNSLGGSPETFAEETSESHCFKRETRKSVVISSAGFCLWASSRSLLNVNKPPKCRTYNFYGRVVCAIVSACLSDVSLWVHQTRL